ncbi:hypothetical protein IHE45_17G062500 [Dioscorea alata]|uniref:Uncharacterized protein n=2 Tax=Dioscorea alata TaxID=55571 RepID=A0ACB7UCR3_DIOAL|nr:hypothetical protein IHE45_17G062500 [Dioscorea alata]KAH7658069.1 hypothetical protein IHE45_17G062500 [Dioscorea alata]
MKDPFSAIDAECGHLSISQDSRLLRFPFLDDEGYSPSSSSNDDDDDDDDDDGPSLPPADAPILFYSPPNSPVAGGNTSDPTVVATDAYPADVANNADDAGAANNVDDTDVADAATTTDVADVVTAVDVGTTTTDAAVPDLGLPPKEILTDHPPKRFKKGSRGPKLRSPDPEEDDDDKYRYQSVEILKDLLETRSCTIEVDGRRRLPYSFVEQALADDREKHRRGVNFPRDLPELVRIFFNKCDKRFANTDILDIVKMKGMDFPTVKWWRAGGYEAKKDKEPGGSRDV